MSRRVVTGEAFLRANWDALERAGYNRRGVVLVSALGCSEQFERKPLRCLYCWCMTRFWLSSEADGQLTFGL